MDDCDTLGIKNIICPWLPDERRNSAEIWKKNIAEINAAGKKCVARGFEFAYHNHDFEFQKFNGKTAMETFWESTEPGVVKSELDVYWVEICWHRPGGVYETIREAADFGPFEGYGNGAGEKVCARGYGDSGF